jgi:inosose dehydratase
VKFAGAPISWGVCEVPGWGAQLAADRVLSEMRDLDLRATEAGPVGYLGDDAAGVVALLARHDLRLVGGFVPVVLHDSRQREALAAARLSAELFQAAGGQFLVSAVVADTAWSAPRPLDRSEWKRVFEGFARLDEIAFEHDLVHVVHPHWGTLVEQRDEVRRVLEDSEALLCLDTGHLALGATDPAELAQEAAGRVAHVHLKDVANAVATQLRAGELAYVPAVQQGLFTPLGTGSARVAETVETLESTGYDGWYVLEQDVSLASTDPAPGAGPVEDVRRGIEFLQRLGDAHDHATG